MNGLGNRLAAVAAGIAAACVAVPTAGLAQSCMNNSNPNLAKNGNFESGSGTNIPYWKAEWNSRVDPYVYLDRTNPHSGAQDLALGTINAPNDIVQRIKGTSAGTVYTVCFWLYSSPNPTAGVTTFEVLWNNVSELSLTNSGPFSYQYLSVNVLAQGNSTDFLRFRERNKQGFYYLDDVSVQECTGCGLGAGELPDREKQKATFSGQ
jgi:hypothetical protein